MGYRYFRYILLAVLAFGAALQLTYAQAAPASEEELKKQASKLFEEEEFSEAMPMYSQLLSNYPKETLYNYRFGVCLLFNSDDKEKPIKYLEFASQKPDAEKEVHFYLGKAYHLNYRFDDAIKAYNHYKTLVSPKQQKKMEVDREIEACSNGKKLLRYITDITVLEKKELSKENFFYSYDLKGMNGKLVVKPAELITSYDKKKKDKSVVFSNIGSGVMYFSSYGDKGETGRDIYISKRLPNGELGKPQLVQGPINTPYDEDYPYLHPDGKVLYFCSKGHNSMGGYDLFKSVFDETTNTWGKPVNLDFPINTPDDDILYVTDGDEENAYFSSARGSTDGKIAVYKVRVERRPIDVSMIKGEVQRVKSEQQLNSKITVKDLADGQTVGVYYANSNNGSYLLYLPNGGKFLFTVETPGYKAQSEVVQLPVQYELKMLKQAISYDMNDKLVIKNIFDGSAEDDGNYELAMDVIRDKAKLDVNKDEPVPTVTDLLASNDGNDPKKNQDSVPGKPAAENLSNDELVKIAQDDAKEAADEAKELKSEAELATSIANEKNEQALAKAKEAQTILANANSITDPAQKQAEINKANNLNKESDRLTKETVAAMNLANRLNGDAKSKEEEAKLAQQYAEELEKASKSNTPGNLDKLEQLQAKLDELNKRESGSDEAYTALKFEADNKLRELIKAKETSESLQQDIDDREKQAQELRSEANSTKNPDLKSGIIAQAEELEEEKKELQKELDANNEKVARLQDESDRLKNDMELVSSLITKIKGSDPSATLASNDGNNSTPDGNGSDILTTTRKNNGTTIGENSNSNDPGSNNTNSNTNNGDPALVVNNDPVTNGDNSGGTNDPNEGNTSGAGDGNSTSAPVDYSMKFEGDLGEADKLKTGSEKETAKAKIYSDWVASIDKDIEDTKQSLKNTKDKGEKKLYKMKLDDLEKQRKEKDKLAKEAIAKADEAKKQEAVAAAGNDSNENNDPVNANDPNNTSDPAVSNSNSGTNVPLAYSQQFDEKLTSIEQKGGSPYEVEKNREAAYNEWAAAINNDIAQKKKDAEATSDPEMKALLEKKIEDLQTLAKEKESLAAESARKADSLKGQDAVAGTNSNASNSSSGTNDPANNGSNDGSGNAGSTDGSNSMAGSTNDPSNSVTEGDYTAQHEKELNDAEKLASEYQKETAKAKIYESWTDDIKEEITALQGELKDTKDKEKKKELKEKIKQKEEEAKEKDKIAKESAQNAEKLKGQEDALVVNDGGNDPASNGAGTNDPSNNGNSGSNNTSGENPLVNNSDPSNNGSRTNDPLNNGSNDGSGNNSSSENGLANNGNPSNNSSGTNDPANNSNNGSGNAGTNDGSTSLTNSTKDPSNSAVEVDYTAQHEKELNDAEKLASEYQKETAKAKIYESWTNDIKEEITALQGELKDTKDKEKKKELKEKIKQKEEEAKEKEKIAKESAQNAEKLKGQEDALVVNDVGNDPANNGAGTNDPSNNGSSGSNNNSGENPLVNNSDPSNNGSRTNDPSNNGSNDGANNNSSVNSNSSSRYTSPSVIAKEKQANALLAEADKMKEQAEALRSDGSAEEAEALSEQAEKKEAEAAVLLGEANKEQFNSNNNKLEQFAKASANRTEADLSLAELLKDEAKIYFEKAQESRKLAEEATEPYAKANAMEKAYENELTALNKQKSAESIYLKYNTDPTLANAGANNSGSNNGSNNGSANENGLANNGNPSNNGSRTNDGSGNNSNGSTSGSSNENGLANNGDPSNNGSRTNDGSGNNSNGSTNSSSNESGLANNGNPSNNGSRTNDGSGNNDNGSTSSSSNENGLANNGNSSNNGSGTNDGSGNNDNGSTNGSSNENSLANNNDPDTNSTSNGSSNSTGTGNENGDNALSASDIQRVKSSKEYKSYVTLKEEANQASKEAKREFDVAAQFNSEAQRFEAQAKQLRIDAGSLTDPNQKKEASRKADDYTKQANINKFKADSVSELARNTEASATAKRMEADLFLQSLDQATYEGISAVTGDKKNEPQVVADSNTGEGNRVNDGNGAAGNGTNSPGNNGANTGNDNASGAVNTSGLPVTYLSASEMFEKTTGPAYSPNKPIPIDEKLPEGLVFKVQIGAFKNPIPQDLFTGMKPITGETTPQGVTRYTAGLFKNSSTAEKAKEDIRALGYKDAFVVAFYNGKRISMSEAMRLLGGNPVASNNGTAGNDAGTTGSGNDTNGANNRPLVNEADAAGTAPSENLNVVKGLLYTVQVGVYARPVSSTQLYNIQPLYNETAPNGYIRYTSGIYNDLNKAVEAKNIIVSIGISDAFVTAYYNGKRIPVSEAKQLEASNGSGVFATAGNINAMPSRGQGGNITQLGNNVQNTPVVTPVVNNGNGNSNGSNTVTPPGNTASTQFTGASITDKVAASVNDEGVVYKVQIGAFREEVPIDIANKFLRIASGGGIRTYKDENGLTIYTLGVYKTYEQANSLKADLVKEGLADAFVVAFENGAKITVERARDLLGK